MIYLHDSPEILSAKVRAKSTTRTIGEQMKNAIRVVHSRVTGADFFNIYKAAGAETGGGGQSYIDFSTQAVSIIDWRRFLSSFTETQAARGPRWTGQVGSLGEPARSQKVAIYQRRNASICIASQKLQSVSQGGNRIFAWHPEFSEFPQPNPLPVSASDPSIEPLIENLVIYLIQADDDTVWAGYFRRSKPHKNWATPKELSPIFTLEEGIIHLTQSIPFDENDNAWPFGYEGGDAEKIVETPEINRTEDQNTELLFGGDGSSTEAQFSFAVRKIRKRNVAAAKTLKTLYGKCQITGDRYVFSKTDGSPYLEAHHLVPLGEGGADAPDNLVVLSAHMHRMLHYAEVSEIELNRIENNTLCITVNGEELIITWLPEHAELVLAAQGEPAD